MIGRRNIIIAISAIVVFAATVGFFITLDVSPQIAYARLFIDAGLIIGVIAVVMAFYRERVIPTDSITHALRALKSGKYKTRISVDETSPLKEIAATINELAIALEAEYEKQAEIKRNLREELLPARKQKETTKDFIVSEHSIHPELGPVLTIPMTNVPRPLREMTVEPMAKVEPQRLNNTLIGSNPPAVATEEVVNQDLGELYQRFVDAQREEELEQIEYPIFLKTIEKATLDLKASYQCNDVFFDIVKDDGLVALQPKIIR